MLISGPVFVGFCCALWFLECDDCVLPARKFFWDPVECGHWGFQVKCVSRYWELTSRDEDGLSGGW